MNKHTRGPIWVSQAHSKPDVVGWASAGVGDTEIAYFINRYDAQLFKAAPALLNVLRDCVESLSRLPNVDGAYRVTCIEQANALLKAVSQHEQG